MTICKELAGSMIDLREIDDFDKPTISQPPNPGPSTRPGSGEDAYTLIRTQEQRTLKMTVWIMTSVMYLFQINRNNNIICL